MAQTNDHLIVFYDGGCVVCSREMEQYRRRDKGGVLILVDIAAPTFDPTQYGRDLDTFMRQLHVRDASGIYHTGVNAFARIWEVMPQPELHLLAAVIALPGINMLAQGGYGVFARFRRFLPKVEPRCDDGSCRHGTRK